MNALHHDVDRQIDRALQALDSAAPRDGMDQRLLARLENRAAAPVSSWRPLLTFAPPAVALLTVALLLLIFHPSQHTSIPAITQIAGSTATAATHAAPLQIQTLRASSIHASLKPSGDANNSAETDPAYLPSFPAPPAPLTADERRLVRIAQHAHSYDVAQLDAPTPLPQQRQDAVSDFIHHMLAPLVTAESFSPTPAVEHDPPPPVQPDPDSNSSPQ